MIRRVFLVCGQKQSGKDTIGKMLRSELHTHLQSTEVMGFADPVKEIAMIMLGMPHHVAFGGEVDRRNWTKYGRDAREWLQWIGADMGRTANPYVWIHHMQRRLPRPIPR